MTNESNIIISIGSFMIYASGSMLNVRHFKYEIHVEYWLLWIKQYLKYEIAEYFIDAGYFNK